ncbi:MAG: hypothetical protein LUH47_06710 [Clostridiales bacterium]|nr:hypothetical protein [Clostridiales bacterium]
MADLNVWKNIEKGLSLLNSRYDLSIKNIVEIDDGSESRIDCISNCFYVGVTQGYKQATAEMKRKEV